MKIRLLIMSLAFFFLLSACAHLSFKSPTEESLRETVDKVWTSKTKRRWGPVYDQANEEYKTYVEKEDFIRKSNLIYKAYSIEDIKMEGAGKAVVTVRFTVSYQGMDFTGTAPEEWVWEKGEWRVNLVKSLDTPFGSVFKKPEAPEK